MKMQLLAEGMELEEFGGHVQCVETAARAGTGLDALEEALLLQVRHAAPRQSAWPRVTARAAT